MAAWQRTASGNQADTGRIEQLAKTSVRSMAMAQTAFKSSGGSSAQARGLAIIRILIGVFLICESLGKLPWLVDTAPLSQSLAGWLEKAPSISRWYLQTIAIPGVRLFARLVVLGEFSAGLALILGVWTRVAAAAGFLMVLNFHVASGAIFKYSFLTNGYGLPVVGSLLGLAVGGRRLPFSVRRGRSRAATGQ